MTPTGGFFQKGPQTLRVLRLYDQQLMKRTLTVLLETYAGFNDTFGLDRRLGCCGALPTAR